MTVKQFFLKLKTEQKKEPPESGRSMVEMLGVLAIIGVLSIGGIAGYTMAMNRYRANEIIDTASKVSVIAMSKQDCDEYGICAYMDDVTMSNNVAGVTMMEGYHNGSVMVGNPRNPGVYNAIKSIAGNKFTGWGERASILLNFEAN